MIESFFLATYDAKKIIAGLPCLSSSIGSSFLLRTPSLGLQHFKSLSPPTTCRVAMVKSAISDIA